MKLIEKNSNLASVLPVNLFLIILATSKAAGPN